MKLRIVHLTFFTIFFLFGCGKQEAPSLPLAQSVQPESYAENIEDKDQREIVINIEKIKNQISAKTISEKEGLTKIGAEIKKLDAVTDPEEDISESERIFNENVNKPSTNSSSTKKLDLMSTIVQIIGSLPSENSSEEVSRVSLILGMGEIDSTDQERSSLEMKLEQLFLMMTLNLGKISRAEHEFVINYFLAKKISIERSGNVPVKDNMAIRYFYDHIQQKNSASKLSANVLFKQNAVLVKLVNNQKNLDYIFRDVFLNLNLTNSNEFTITMHELFGKLLDHVFCQKDKAIIFNLNFVKTALAHGNWQVDQLNNLRASDGLASIFKQLDLVIGLLDKVPLRFKGITFEDWVALLDERTNVIMYNFQNTVAKFDPSFRRELEESTIAPAHPYIKIYLARGIISNIVPFPITLNRPELTVPNDFSDYEKSFKNAVSAKLNESETNVNISSETEKMKKYINLFYAIEAKRFWMETQGHNNKSGEDLPTRNSIYRKQFENLVEILNLRFEKNLTFEQVYYNRQPETMLDGLDQFSDKAITKQQELHGKVFLEAGIYQSNDDMDLKGDELRFSPLAMIYLPGKNISLSFNKIENAWIDVSGRDWGFAPIDHSQDENKSTGPSQVVTQTGALTKYSINYGYAPKKRSRGANGENAGSIQCLAPGLTIGIGQYVAVGGNGESGPSGFTNNAGTSASELRQGELSSLLRGRVTESGPFFQKNKIYPKGGAGGDGGDAGSGGVVEIITSGKISKANMLLSSGIAGDAGQDGPNYQDGDDVKGKRGLAGKTGTLKIRIKN